MSWLGWADLDDWTLLLMQGPDSRDFLQRLTTNEMPRRAGDLCHTFFLSVQGRPLVEFWALALDDGFALQVPSAVADDALTELDKFHFGEKLQMSRTPLQGVTLVGRSSYEQAPAEAICLPNRRLAVDAIDVFLPSEQLDECRQGLPEIATEQLEEWRIEKGTPAFGKDFDQQTLFLEMADPDSYSESKGCYPGQEVVARILHRGRVNRRLRGLRSQTPLAAGEKLLGPDKERGWVTSTVVSKKLGPIALGYVRREVEEEDLAIQSESGVAVTVCDLPFEGSK